MIRTVILATALIWAGLSSGCTQAESGTDPEHPLSSMPLRSIGPALTSGRVSDFAFHPGHRPTFYVAMASAGVWKTTNDGISWEHVFANEGSYATGVVVLHPDNPEVVWVGSGENNSQRSVGFGDGVYRSLDGGRTWRNMGLRDSGHISMIRFDPRDANTIYVAAQGPLWNSGGDRGLYKSTDSGESWQRVLEIDADTGVNEFLVHPQRPDSLVASSYQRRRHVWTLINGGPGSGIHKSDDGGASWRRISSGLPQGEMGRIGLAAAPSSPNIVYAIIEAGKEEQGVYRSTDFGEHWVKQSSHMTTSPQYYNELIVDPNDPDRVYAVDTFTHVSEDGGKTWRRLSIENRHVDDHALWINPADSRHLIIGGDGGIFESFDGGELWRHHTNLPTVQFYRATPDDAQPFYNVCAGTQDNHTLCGPSRTTYSDGITNADWWIAQFGDGFKARIDPDDPNIVYAQAQHGVLVRFDKRTGERTTIVPQPAAGDNNYKWNWNSPLIISPHDSRRLYFGSERLFRSDDRGDSWRAVSPDLTRQLDRNSLDVMGRVWSVDAVAKNASTSMYGAMIALDESPLLEGLLYVGTDDGLIRVSQDGGENWSRVSSFGGVPEQSLIEDIVASSHDVDVAYAAVDNHKRGDHKPYVLRSRDRGRSWSLISGDLPVRGTVHALVEDPIDPQLLYAGTEFGLFFTQDGGQHWHEFSGLPTISVRDIEFQKRHDDLVVGTFGLGIYIVDDVSPLRESTERLLAGPVLFQPRDTWLYLPDDRRGWGGKGDYGVNRYAAENPPYGAVINMYLPAALESRRERRQSAEKEAQSAGGDNPYPSWDELRAEDREEQPSVVVTIRDSQGQVVRRIDAPTDKGFHRLAWDMRYPAPDPIVLDPSAERSPWESPPMGPLAAPGRYQASLSQRVEGVWQDLQEPVTFELRPLSEGSLPAADPQSRLAFELEASELYRAILGSDRAVGEYQLRLDHLRVALDETPAADESLKQEVRRLHDSLQDIRVVLQGDSTRTSRYEPAPMGLTMRIAYIVGALHANRASVPAEYRKSLEVAESEFSGLRASLEGLARDLASLEQSAEAAGAPWTPGRLPGVR